MNARDLAIRFEGLRLTPYVCPAGFWTVGYGHLCQPDQQPITMDDAESLLAGDLAIARAGTLGCCPGLDGDRLEALTDFVFNLGAGRLRASALRRAVNDRDWPAAMVQIRRWVFGGGRRLPGLVIRRAAEAEMLG